MRAQLCDAPQPGSLHRCHEMAPCATPKYTLRCRGWALWPRRSHCGLAGPAPTHTRTLTHPDARHTCKTDTYKGGFAGECQPPKNRPRGVLGVWGVTERGPTPILRAGNPFLRILEPVLTSSLQNFQLFVFLTTFVACVGGQPSPSPHKPRSSSPGSSTPSPGKDNLLGNCIFREQGGQGCCIDTLRTTLRQGRQGDLNYQGVWRATRAAVSPVIRPLAPFFLRT